MADPSAARDRTVHARYTGMEIVRYDRSGKWYLEPTDARLKRQHVKIKDAVAAARWGIANANGSVTFGLRGGNSFERMVQGADPTPSAASVGRPLPTAGGETEVASSMPATGTASAAWVADRLAALNAAANRHGGDHELSAVCSHLHSELPKLAADLDEATVALQTCLHLLHEAGYISDPDYPEVDAALALYERLVGA